MGRVIRCRRRGDDGFTVVELLLGASLSAILMVMVLLWLFSAQNASDQIAGNLEEESGLVLTLELALAEISDARPTALCLNPDPNAQDDPSPTTTTPSSTISECATGGRGDNWGYWPTGSSPRLFVPGSPFHEAKADKLCFYALQRSDVADPTSPKTPWGRCLEKSSTAAQLLTRTLAPETVAQNDDLVAADPDSYKWTSGGTWTERSLGRIETIKFQYHDFNGTDITPTGGTTLNRGRLDDIAMVTITLTDGVTPDLSKVSGSLAIRANAFSPCRQAAPTAPTCPRLDTPAAPTLTAGSAQIDAAWTSSSGNVPATDYDVQYKQSSDTDWTDFTGTVAVTGTDWSATISSLTAGTAYDVRVRATNTADESDWSASASATPT